MAQKKHNDDREAYFYDTAISPRYRETRFSAARIAPLACGIPIMGRPRPSPYFFRDERNLPKVQTSIAIVKTRNQINPAPFGFYRPVKQ